MTEPREFFEQVKEAYVAASRKTGTIDFDIDLAGKTLRISFTSETLFRRLSRALAHRVRESGEPSEIDEVAKILVWDAASSDIMPPSPPWGPNDYLQKGRIRGFNRDGIHTSFHLGPGVLSMFDDESNTGIFWTRDAAILPDYQIGSPLLIVLQWWAERSGLHLVHAGSVGTDDGGILLVGAGGSGKSTTALSCVDAPGLSYVSDDYCLVDMSGGYQSHSLYNTGKLDAHSLTLLPQFELLAANRDRPDDEKAIIYLAECRLRSIVSSFDLKAVVRPVTGYDSTSHVRASPAVALRALAPSTIFQLTGAGKHTFQAMAELARDLPCFELRLGGRMDDVPSTITKILRETAA